MTAFALYLQQFKLNKCCFRILESNCVCAILAQEKLYDPAFEERKSKMTLSQPFLSLYCLFLSLIKSTKMARTDIGKFIKESSFYRNLEFSKCCKSVKTTVCITDAFAKFWKHNPQNKLMCNWIWFKKQKKKSFIFWCDKVIKGKNSYV